MPHWPYTHSLASKFDADKLFSLPTLMQAAFYCARSSAASFFNFASLRIRNSRYAT
jgi:hypothetical protein